jgi:hypothetical protein
MYIDRDIYIYYTLLYIRFVVVLVIFCGSLPLGLLRRGAVTSTLVPPLRDRKYHSALQSWSMAEKLVNLLLQIVGIKSYSNKIKHLDIISGHLIHYYTIYSSEIVRLSLG